MSSLNATATPFVPTSSDMDLVRIPISKPDMAALEYPFSFICGSNDANGWCNVYKINDFAEGLVGEEKCDAGKFPDNIAEYYWVFEGHNDEEAWKLLCKLDNGNYALYLAWCDYTGFDCQGGMKLIVSKSLDKLFYDGMTEQQRYQCLKDKKNPRKPVEQEYFTSLHRARDTPPFVVDPDAPKITMRDYINNLPKARVPKPFEWEWDVPVVPEYKPKGNRAFIRVWNDGKELILNLSNVNGLEMDALEYAISGLTAQFLTPKPLVGANGPKPKKKFYRINICSGTNVTDIDDYFKKRFGNPNKKWELRMLQSRDSFIRKWGKVEVSFILC